MPSMSTRSDDMDVDDGREEASRDESLLRIGGMRLQSSPSRGDNIDIAPSGAVLVRCDEAIHVVHVADQVADFLPRDDSDKARHYSDSSQHTPLFRSHALISSTEAQTSYASGRNALGGANGVDAQSLDARFVHAQWAPSEIGPLASPIFAALTTKRTLFVYLAPTNQFRGPWEVLQCVNDRPAHHESQHAISSFTWLPGSATADSAAPVRLAGGGVDGRLYVWTVRRDGEQYDVHLEYSCDLSTSPITALACSRLNNHSMCRLAAVSSDGVQILSVTLADVKTGVVATNAAPSVDDGLSITWLSWHDSTLIYCSPGEVHGFDAHGGGNWTVILHDDREEGGSMYLQPPASIKLDSSNTCTVTLQDGFVYFFQVPLAQQSSQAVVVRPTAEIPVPIEELAEEQRAVERLRGLYARKDDGAGLTFLCHDANDVAVWTYLISSTCQLDIAITDKSDAENDVERATDMIQRMWAMEAYGKANEAVLVAQEQAKLRRSLLVHYRESAKKAAIVEVCVGRIESVLAVEHTPNLKVAVQLASWLQNESDLAPEASERIAALADELQLASRRDALTRQVARCTAALEAHPRRNDMRDEVHARLLVVWMMIASAPMAQQLSRPGSATWDVAQRLGWREGDERVITQWAARLHKHVDVDVGELCPACEAPVAIGASSLYTARCKNGHPWRRCGVTHAIMTDIQALCCSVCAQQAIRPIDATSDIQRILLDAAERCTVCGGSWVAI